MSDLASVWENLTDVQRANMSELVAGKRQGNIVMAMMSNYKDMQDSLTTALNSTNSALIENEKYMESIEAKSAQFKNTVMGKWQEALNSDVIKNFVVAMTTLVEVLGNAEIVVALLTTAFLIWKGTAITSAIKALLTFIVTTNTANASLLAMLVTTQGLTKAMNFLKATMATNPLGLLAVVATTATVAIYGLTNAVKKHREEQQKLIEVSQNQIQTLKSQKEGLKELTSEYENLKDKEKNLTATIDEKKRLLEVQKELVEKYGVSATGINLEGEAYANSTEAIKLRTLALEEEITKEKEKLKLNILSADALNTEDIRSNTKSRDKAQKKIETAIKVLPYLEENDPYAANLKKEQIKQFEKDIEEANLIIQEASKNRRKYLEYEAQETIKTLESNGKEMSDSAKLVVSEFAKSLALEPENIETQQQALQDFINKVSDSNLDVLIEQYNKFVSAINSGDVSKQNTDGLVKTSKEIANLIDKLTKGNPYLKEFAINFASLYPPTIAAKKAIDALNDSLKENSFKTASDNLKFYQETLDKLNTDGLTSDLMVLARTHDNLKDKTIENVEDYKKVLLEGIEESKNEWINAEYEKQFVNNESLKNMIGQFQSYQKFLKEAYGIDVNNWREVAKSKVAIEAQLLKSLAMNWANYLGKMKSGSMSVGMAMYQIGKDQVAFMKQLQFIQALGEAQKGFEAFVPDFSSGGKSSSSSSSKSFEKTFEVWKEALEAINAELETLKDQIDDVNSFEQKTEIYDQMILLLEKKQNLLLEISKTFDSNLKQAKNHLRSYIGKGLSESDFNKIMSGSTNTLEIDIKNENIAKAIEDFRKLKDESNGVKKEIGGINDELKNIKTQKFELVITTNNAKYESYNALIENSNNLLSKHHELSKEYTNELNKQVSITKQKQQDVIKEINYHDEIIKKLKAKKQLTEEDKYMISLHTNRLKDLIGVYWELERAIDSNKKALEDIEFKKFENSLSQLERALEPLNNKISNLKSNLDLLSDTNFDGKINLITQQMIANKDLVSQLEEQLRQLLSTTPKNAKEAQALAQSIKNTKSALFAARKETILYGKELGKLQLAKIKYGFDKVTNSLEQQMNITEHLIDMMIDGIPTGIDLNFKYATEVVDNTGIEDTENLAQAGINIQEEFQMDSLESQRDYQQQMIDEQQKYLSEQTQQFQKFFDDFLKIVAGINGVHIFDTTLSDFARVNGASDETISKLKELEKELFNLMYNRWKNSKENVGKIKDDNNDGIDDITGTWIDGYNTILSETKNYLQDVVDEYGTKFDQIISVVKEKSGKIARELPIIDTKPNQGNQQPSNPPNNPSNPPNNPPTGGGRTPFRSISSGNYFIENGTSYMQFSNFDSDAQSAIRDNNILGINRNNWWYYPIRQVYETAGYNVEFDGTSINIYKYAKGTKGHPGGLARVSEEGRELLIYPDGSAEISSDTGEEIRNLPKGTQVIPHKETEDILKNRSYAKGTKNPNGLWIIADDAVRDDDGRVRWRDHDLYYIDSHGSYWWVNQALLGRDYFTAEDNESFVYFGNERPTTKDIREHFGLESVWHGSNSYGYAKSLALSHGDSVFNIEDEWFWGDTGGLAGYSEPTDEEKNTHFNSNNNSSNNNSSSNNSNNNSSILPNPIMPSDISNSTDVNNLYDTLLNDVNSNITNLRSEVTKFTTISKPDSKYLDENGVEQQYTEEQRAEASELAIEATNKLMSAEKKLKRVIKDKYDYQFSALEKQKDGLNDIIDLEDDLQDQLAIKDDNDFAGRLSLTEQLLGNAEDRRGELEYLRDIARTLRDTFAEGTAEWIILDEKFKNYGEQLEEVEKDIKNIGTSIKQISFDSLTASFNKFIKDVNEKLDKLDFASQFIDENDLQGKTNNLTNIITEGLSKIAILTDKIQNVAINPETAEAWAKLKDDPVKQAEFLKTWQEDLKDTILLVFNSEKALAEIPKQRLEKMSNVENEIVQMIRKRVEVEKESLDEQLRLTEENIDKRIKYINKLYDEQDYKDDLFEKEDKLKELYAERAKWSLDTSIEGQNKLKEIDKQIKSQEKDIAKTQRQRGKDLRIEALNDEKENAQKITEEKQKELDKQLQADNLYAEAQKAIQTGQIEFLTIANGEVVKINGVAQTGIMNLSTAFGTFVDTYGEGLSLLGGQIKSDFIDGIVLANTEIQNLIGSINSLTTIEGYKDYTKPKTPPSSVNPDMAEVKPKNIVNLGNKTITDSQKTWTIVLSQEVDPNNLPIVNITDENGNILFNTKPEVGTDGKSLIIKPPSTGYKFGQKYKLVVSGGKSKSGKDLKDTTTLSFDYNRGKDVTQSEDISRLVIEEYGDPKKFNTPVSKLYEWIFENNNNAQKINDYIGLPENYKIADSLAFPKSYTELQNAALKVLKDLGVSFDTGGFTGSFNGSKLAFLHEKELILNKVDTENILKTIDITRNIVNNLKPLTFQNLTNGLISKQDLQFNFENLIRVEGNVDKDALPGLKDIADYTINKLKVELNKQGVFRGV